MVAVSSTAYSVSIFQEKGGLENPVPYIHPVLEVKCYLKTDREEAVWEGTGISPLLQTRSGSYIIFLTGCAQWSLVWTLRRLWEEQSHSLLGLPLLKLCLNNYFGETQILNVLWLNAKIYYFKINGKLIKLLVVFFSYFGILWFSTQMLFLPILHSPFWFYWGGKEISFLSSWQKEECCLSSCSSLLYIVSYFSQFNSTVTGNNSIPHTQEEDQGWI